MSVNAAASLGRATRMFSPRLTGISIRTSPHVRTVRARVYCQTNGAVPLLQFGRRFGERPRRAGNIQRFRDSGVEAATT